MRLLLEPVDGVSHCPLDSVISQMYFCYSSFPTLADFLLKRRYTRKPVQKGVSEKRSETHNQTKKAARSSPTEHTAPPVRLPTPARPRRSTWPAPAAPSHSDSAARTSHRSPRPPTSW